MVNFHVRIMVNNEGLARCALVPVQGGQSTLCGVLSSVVSAFDVASALGFVSHCATGEVDSLSKAY